MSETVVEQVVQPSHRLGRAEADWAKLGEGNTSARQDARTFWVKASGGQLYSITAGGFVHRIDSDRRDRSISPGSHVHPAKVRPLPAARPAGPT